MLKIFFNKYKINNIEKYDKFELNNYNIIGKKDDTTDILLLLDIPKNTNLYYFDLECNKNYIILYIYIYIDKLENFIINGLDIVERKNIFDFLNKYYNNYNNKKRDKINIVNNIINNVNILDWMIYIENDFVKEYEYYSNNILKIYNIYYDLYKCTFYTEYNKQYVNVKGGIIFNDNCYENITTLLTLCDINNNFILNNNYKLISNANLILCSKYNINHWINEICNISNNVKIVSIINKKDFDLYSYNDLINADYVFFSINFLNNYNYKNLWKKYKLNDNITYNDCLNNMKLEFFRNNKILELTNPFLSLIYWKRIIVDNFTEIMLGQTYYIDLINSIKSNYKWFLYNKKPENQSEILNILSVVFEFPKNYLEEYSLFFYQESNIININNIINNLFFINYNTKKIKDLNINEEIKYLNFTNIENILYNSYLDIYSKNNDIDNLYTIIYNKILQDMFTSYMNCKTLDEIRNYILTLNQNNLFKYNKIKKKLLNKKIDLENNLKSNNSNLLLNINNNINEINNNINIINNYINNFNNLDFNLDSCSICLEQINENDVGITICGHIFCFLCIIENIKYNKKCPYCRSNLQKKDIFKIINKNFKTDLDLDIFNKKIKKIKKKNENISFSFQQKNEFLVQKLYNKDYDCSDISILIELYGTKIANVICYLKEIYDNQEKIILHTILEEEFVNNLCNIFNKYNIKTLNCCGNDNQRNKNIHKFNEENYKVLIMPNKYIDIYNIIKITKIIYLEPLFNNINNEQIINLLYDANKNSNIDVIRFITKNTIEEKIHNK